MVLDEISEDVANAIELRDKIIEESNEDKLYARFTQQINDIFFSRARKLVEIEMDNTTWEEMRKLINERDRCLKVWGKP